MHCKRLNFISLFCLLFANILAWSCVSVYMPCLGEVMVDFGVSAMTAKLTVMANILGSVVGRVFWGPMSDDYGRRKILLCSLGFALVGTLGGYLSSGFEYFVLCRLVQGLGTGVISVVTMSIISDVYIGAKRASLIGTVEMSWPVAWGLSPILGAYCASHYHWKVSFVILFLMLLILCIIIFFKLPETLIERRNEFSFKGMMFDYKSLMQNKLFVIYAIIPGFVLSGYMVFAINSPLVYIKRFGLSSVQFSLMQSIPLAVYFLTAIFYKYVIMRFGTSNARNFGICSLSVFGCFVLSGILNFSSFTPSTVIIFICMQCLANGFLIPVGSSEALRHAPSGLLGTASSMISLGRNLIISMSFLVSGLFDVSESMLFTIVLMIVVIVLFLFFAAIFFQYSGVESFENNDNSDTLPETATAIVAGNNVAQE